jgi:hypothetical protein
MLRNGIGKEDRIQKTEFRNAKNAKSAPPGRRPYRPEARIPKVENTVTRDK